MFDTQNDWFIWKKTKIVFMKQSHEYYSVVWSTKWDEEKHVREDDVGTATETDGRVNSM